MGRGWKRAGKLSTAPVPYPTVVLQMDQAASANQGLLRNQRERGEDSNLDRGLGLRPRRHRPEAFGPGGQPLPNPTDFERYAFRENAHFTGPSSIRLQ